MSKALDTGKIVVGVYLDFLKAFDKIDHHILFKSYMQLVYEEILIMIRSKAI